MSEGLILPLRLPPRIVPEDNGPNRDSRPTGRITSWVLGYSRTEIRLLLESAAYNDLCPCLIALGQETHDKPHNM